MGYSPKNRQKFKTYADYVLNTMQANGVKKTTLSGYRSLLKRINPILGDFYLDDITPQILNKAYAKLSSETKNQVTAIATPELAKILKERNLTKVQLHKMSNVAVNTITIACQQKNVAISTAEKISNALEMNLYDLFVIKKNEQSLSAKSLSSQAKLIGLILKQAEQEMLVKYNAYSKSKAPKNHSHEADYFETEEIIKILDYLENEPLKWQVIMHLLIVTGARRGEIAGLKFDKIDWNKNLIKIDTSLLYTGEYGTFEDTPKTSSGSRYIPLPQETMHLLRQYKRWYFELRNANGDRWNDSGYMFVQDNGKPMNPTSITSYCSKFGKKYGINHCHPHKFRHTYASTLILNHMDDISLAKCLGHSKPSTTKNIYGHVMDRASDLSSEIIANSFLSKQNHA